MNDLTLWLLIIGCPLAIWALVSVEMYFIIRYTRKNAILNRIKMGDYLTNQSFDIILPATLYGQSIKVAIKRNFIHIINDSKFFSIYIDDFTSIKYKNGTYIFRLANISIANTKVFSIKCTDDRLASYLNIGDINSQNKTSKPKSFKEYVSTSTGRFVLIGIIYVIFFIIFALTGNTLYYILLTAMFAVGLTIYIAQHHVSNSKKSTEGTKSEILQKQEKQKLFYSKVIAVCLGIVIVITLLCAIPTNNNNDDYDPYECFWCNGTGMAEDAYGKLHYCSHCHGSGRQ